jgi:hypothetical protein
MILPPLKERPWLILELNRIRGCLAGACVPDGWWPTRTSAADQEIRPTSHADYGYLQRSARLGFSRYLLWQLAQASVIASAAVRILSVFFDCAAL